MSHSTLAKDATGIAWIKGLADFEGNYINDATCTLESLVHRETGVAVTGITFPLTLVYVAASNGNYKAVTSEDATLTNGETYTAVFKAISSAPYEKQWEETLRVQEAVA